MIKLKKLIKESKYAWDREFGDPLPTFKDIAETHQNKPVGINERKLSSRQKKAILIAIEMSGNMTGAVKKIERIKKGLSNDKKVKDALRLANESINKESIKESKLPKFIVPSDVSYYMKHWSDTFDELGSYRAIDYGPRESDMYDWNGRANYQAATKEFHTHMSKVAKKLNTAVKELDGLYKVWNKIIDKHRKNDGR